MADEPKTDIAIYNMAQESKNYIVLHNMVSESNKLNAIKSVRSLGEAHS